jgi:hypothetical protein
MLAADGVTSIKEQEDVVVESVMPDGEICVRKE